MKLRYCISILGLILSGVTFAVEPAAWVGPATIKKISVQPNGRMYLLIDENTPDLGCQGNQDGWLEFDTNAPHFESQYSLVLASYMAGKKVQVYVNHCGYYPYAQNTNVGSE